MRVILNGKYGEKVDMTGISVRIFGVVGLAAVVALAAPSSWAGSKDSKRDKAAAAGKRAKTEKSARAKRKHSNQSAPTVSCVYRSNKTNDEGMAVRCPCNFFKCDGVYYDCGSAGENFEALGLATHPKENDSVKLDKSAFDRVCKRR